MSDGRTATDTALQIFAALGGVGTLTALGAFVRTRLQARADRALARESEIAQLYQGQILEATRRETEWRTLYLELRGQYDALRDAMAVETIQRRAARSTPMPPRTGESSSKTPASEPSSSPESARSTETTKGRRD